MGWGANNIEMTSDGGRAGTAAVLPMPVRERIELLDALRGFALFGVVVINMSVDTVWSDDAVVRTAGRTDDVVAGVLGTFGAGRFLTIFSLLFGAGVFMQIQRCRARGVGHVALLLRRFLILLAIGLMHYLLIGWTDILHAYAVLGIVLLAFHRFSPAALLVTALAIVTLNLGEPRPLIVMAGERVVTSARDLSATPEPGEPAPEGPSPETDATDDDVSRLTRVYAQGAYGEIVQENLRDFLDYIRFFAPRWWLGSLLPVMLLGAYVARRRILEQVEEHVPVLRAVFVWGLALGLAGSVLPLLGDMVWTDRAESFPARQVEAAGQVVGIRALGLAYASGFVLALRHPRFDWLVRPLAAVGRTAFSNYLLQTAVAVAVFFGIGLGMYGRANPVLGALIAVVTFAAQTAASVWWLSRFRYGPAEWLWRSLSYGRLQPMRR